MSSADELSMMKSVQNQLRQTEFDQGHRTGKRLQTREKGEPKAPVPLKICIAFDEEASARSAEILIKHVASDVECETQSFRFDELHPPERCVAAARTASVVDILMLAVRDDRMLPDQVRSWLGLCLGLRDENANGALVVLVPSAEEESAPDSLWDYLETVAAIGGMVFYPKRRKAHHIWWENNVREGCWA
jgi:hypothetical protein